MPEMPGPIIRELLDYWSSIRRGNGIPDRADLDPVDIPRLLPHLYLLDVLPDATYRFRLIGTALVERLGYDPTGRTVSDVIDGEHLTYMHALFARAIASRQAIYSCSSYKYPPKEHLTVHRIILPLTHGGDEVAILIVGQHFEAWPGDNRLNFNAILKTAEHVGQSFEVEEFQVPEANPPALLDRLADPPADAVPNGRVNSR